MQTVEVPLGGVEPVRVDARSERWREHRVKVREEIVDAALAAIDREGPQVSLRQIAAQAGTAKPKFYRHFSDKADLFGAIVMRLQYLLVAAIFPNVDLATDPIREVVHRCVAEYVGLVEKHPNVMRFVQQGQFSQPGDSGTYSLKERQALILALAQIFNNEMREVKLDAASLDLAAAACFGAVSSATDWWLATEQDGSLRMPAAELIDHLTTVMLGTFGGIADLLGVDLDPDQPLRKASRRDAAAG